MSDAATSRFNVWFIALGFVALAAIGNIAVPRASAQRDQPVTISIGDYTIDGVDGQQLVEVTVVPPTIAGQSVSVGAIGIEIEYDGDVVQPRLIESGQPDCEIGGGGAGSCGPLSPTNTVQVAAFNASPGWNDEDVVLMLVFDATGVPGTSPLTISVDTVTTLAGEELRFATVSGSIVVNSQDSPAPTPTAPEPDGQTATVAPEPTTEPTIEPQPTEPPVPTATAVPGDDQTPAPVTEPTAEQAEEPTTQSTVAPEADSSTEPAAETPATATATATAAPEPEPIAEAPAATAAPSPATAESTTEATTESATSTITVKDEDSNLTTPLLGALAVVMATGGAMLLYASRTENRRQT